MVKKIKNKNRKKSLSRLMAVQIFYQNDFFKDEKTIEEVKEDMIENYALDFEEDTSSYREKIDEDFLNNLVLGISMNYQKLDEEILTFLQKDWSIEKLDSVLLQILRCGVFELKYMKDIPANVVVDEYVDIAASFFDEKKTTFINAVLDGLAKKLIANRL